MQGSGPQQTNNYNLSVVNATPITYGSSGIIQITGTGFSNFSSAPTVTIPGVLITNPQVAAASDTTIFANYSSSCNPSVGPDPISLSFPAPDGTTASATGSGTIVLPPVSAATIQFNDATITSTQSVVVGQQISLTSSPPNLPNSCFAFFSPSTSGQDYTPAWGSPSANGYPVGGYPASTGSASVTGLPASASTTYLFFWSQPGSSLSQTVSFQYLLPATGQTFTSPLATAVFAVSGVTSANMTIGNEVVVHVNDLTGCTAQAGGPNLVYGNLTGPVPACGNPSGTAGITFYEQGNQPGPGNFFFTQVITHDVSSNGYNSNGQTMVCTSTGGVDGAYPYQNKVGVTSVNDAPLSPLAYSPNASRQFGASMYLMWQSTTTGSIPVPLGYIPWVVNGSATCNALPCNVASGWTASGNGGPTSQFSPSSTSQPDAGYPRWTAPAMFSCVYQ